MMPYNIKNQAQMHRDLIKIYKIAGEKLIYQLFSDETEIENENVKVYGIRITSKLYDVEETSEVSDITSRYEFAQEIFDMLIENAVLPCTLKDIIIDLIS